MDDCIAKADGNRWASRFQMFWHHLQERWIHFCKAIPGVFNGCRLYLTQPVVICIAGNIMFAAVIVYFQTTGLMILDNGGPLLQSDILCYSLNIVHRKPPEFKKCEKLRKFFNCTQLSQKSEALRRTLVVYHLPMIDLERAHNGFHKKTMRV